MDITFLGQSSFKLKGKSATVVTDPYEPYDGKKFPRVEADIVTVSHSGPKHSAADQVGGDPLILTGPGEYEIKEVKIVGVPSFQDEKEGKVRGKDTIFNMKVDGLNVCHLGSLGQTKLTANQMEDIGGVDILIIPTGGVDTLDAGAAAKIAAELEPKIVIPMHFGGDGDVNLEPVDKFLKEMGAERSSPQPKLSIKKDRLPAELTVVLLDRPK
jgi:L-ascorbate metabolism protein UlaG (beta-lactamase superfamily)